MPCAIYLKLDHDLTFPHASPARHGGFCSRDFRLYQLARGVVSRRRSAVVAVAAVYSITHRPLDLGYTGLALFLRVCSSAGCRHVADRFDRRHVLLLTYDCNGLLHERWSRLPIVAPGMSIPSMPYCFVIGTGRAFAGPAGTSLIPQLVPEKHFVNAVTGAEPFSSSRM